jgi:hypothetical protein
MSTVLVVTPLVIAGWPILTAAISGAVGSMGFAMAQSGRSQVRASGKTPTRAEIEVEDSEILAGTGAAGEELTVERDGVKATFSRDARGALRLCLEGHHLSKSELEALGEELIGRVTQQYAYHRVISELKERQMDVVEQTVGEDQAIHIRVRNN